MNLVFSPLRRELDPVYLLGELVDLGEDRAGLPEVEHPDLARVVARDQVVVLVGHELDRGRPGVVVLHQA